MSQLFPSAGDKMETTGTLWLSFQRDMQLPFFWISSGGLFNSVELHSPVCCGLCAHVCTCVLVRVFCKVQGAQTLEAILCENTAVKTTPAVSSVTDIKGGISMAAERYGTT